MIRTLLATIGAAIAYTAPPRPYSLRDRYADAQARAADPTVAADAQALLRAHRELSDLRRIAGEYATMHLRVATENADLREAIGRHKAARKRAGRMVRGLIRERDAARRERDAECMRRASSDLGWGNTLEELATCRADRDAALDQLHAALEERDAARADIARLVAAINAVHGDPAPDPEWEVEVERIAPPKPPLRNFVREELIRDGYTLDAIGVLRRDEWHVELRDDHLARRRTVTGPVAIYPYRDDDTVVGRLTDIGEVIARAQAAYDAFDAAGGAE